MLNMLRVGKVALPSVACYEVFWDTNVLTHGVISKLVEDICRSCISVIQKIFSIVRLPSSLYRYYVFHPYKQFLEQKKLINSDSKT